MTRSRKTAHAPDGVAWHSPLAVGLTVFFALCLLAGSFAWSASPGGRSASTQGAIVGPSTSKSAASPIATYVAQAYSVVGPVHVVSVSSSGIVLYMGVSDLSIDLKGKNVTVIDQNSKSLTLSAVKKGTRVYVCRKANDVVVVVLPAVATTGGAKK